jgi:hypothetical protein
MTIVITSPVSSSSAVVSVEYFTCVEFVPLQFLNSLLLELLAIFLSNTVHLYLGHVEY